ncbi:MAG TPA: hypothetical protein VK277_00895 [Acidimicrobiales bacterium]|nr:hypothetical protein [Acidimicrobiales bacterium]
MGRRHPSSSIRQLARAVSAAAVVLAASWAVAVPASAGASGPKVGPDQYFGGLVNGSTGDPQPAVIQMACFGPIRTGETGHPLPGQTIGIFLGEDAAPFLGFTGANANQIGVFFNAPPPVGGPVAGRITFTHYGTKKLRTSLVLPCAGSGNVFFVPLPMDPPVSRAAVVPVIFVGQP